MRIEAGGGRREGTALEAMVESVEYLGADSLVAAKAGAQSLLVRVPGHATVSTGNTVHVAWERAHEFYLKGYTTFSDIQEQRPVPLVQLEMSSS